MNDSQKVLLKLIIKSQFGSVDNFFTGNNIDWDSVYEEAVQQSVEGLVVHEIPENIFNSDGKWKHIKDNHNAYSIRYYYAEADLIKMLEKAEIPFVILKGTAAAIYYRYPLRRAMGDIDFLVPEDFYFKTRDLLIDNGYAVGHQNERNIEFIKNTFSFELHHHFSHEDLDIEKYLITGMKQCELTKIASVEFPILPKLPNGLVLLDHMRNHLQSGLGLRQIVDWMMYVNRELNDKFWYDEFLAVVDSLRLTKFAKVTTRMCQLYLGLPDTISWCKDADEDLCRELIELLFVSGNFGRKTGKGITVDSVRSQIKKHGLFKWLQYAGENTWNAYNKHHWLKPFCWIYQIFRYARLVLKFDRSYSQLSDDINRSNNRNDLLKELEIY